MLAIKGIKFFKRSISSFGDFTRKKNSISITKSTRSECDIILFHLNIIMVHVDIIISRMSHNYAAC